MGDKERAYLVAGKRKDLEIIAAVLVVEFDEILVVARRESAVARDVRHEKDLSDVLRRVYRAVVDVLELDVLDCGN